MQSNSPLFLIESHNEETREVLSLSLKSIEREALHNGYDVAFLARDRFSRKVEVPEEYKHRPVSVHGSIQFCRALQGQVFPGYYGASNTNFLRFAPEYGRSRLFNEQWFVTPFGDFADNAFTWADIIGSANIFIRPESQFKYFPGVVVNVTNVVALRNQYKIDDSTMCILSKIKVPLVETRHFIVDKQVVEDVLIDSNFIGYHDGDELVFENENKEFARLIAALDWQPDTCYVLDVAHDYHGPKIMELNPLGSSGLNGCKAKKLIPALASQAVRDFVSVFE